MVYDFRTMAVRRLRACMTWRASWLQVVVATVAVGEGSGSCRFSAECSGS